MSKLRDSFLVPQEKTEEYDLMSIDKLTIEDDKLQRKAFSMGQSYANSTDIGGQKRSKEWFDEKSRIRHERQTICRIRWSKMKKKDPSLQKYVDKANQALDKFFEGSPSTSRVRQSSASE